MNLRDSYIHGTDLIALIRALKWDGGVLKYQSASTSNAWVSVGDIPTWNQDTSGTATYATNLGTSSAKLTYSNLSGVSGRTVSAGTANYVAYYSAASTISAELYLSTSRGGTGLGSFTQYGILYASSTSALSQITAASTSNKGLVLAVNSSGTGYEWVSKSNNSGTVTSITIENGTGITGGSNTAVTTSGTWTIGLADNYGDTKNPYASKTTKYFLAAPNDKDGTPSFRAIVASDIPTLNLNTTGSANSATYDSKGTILNGIPVIIGTQTAKTGTWTGSLVGTGIKALYTGLTIRYYLPRDPNGNATLTLTLDDGNSTSTGAINCYYNSGRLNTHYGVGSTITLTYYKAGDILINGTATTDNRWIADANYDSGNTAMRLYISSDNIEYSLLARYNTTTVAAGGNDNSYGRFTTGITLNPSTNTITATVFKGSLTGDVTGNCSGTSANVTGTVAVGNGGTSKSSWTKSGMIYASDTTTLALITNPSTASKTWYLKATTDASSNISYEWITVPTSINSATYASRLGTSSAYLTYDNLSPIYTWYTTELGDTDTKINKWKEVENFLSTVTDSDTIGSILTNYVTLASAQTITGAKTFSNPISGDLLGNSTTADRLKSTTAVGSATLPVYFSGGVPIACTASSVFSNLSSNTTNAVSVTVAGLTRTITAATMKSSLGLGSNAYTSTSYLPTAGGTMTGNISYKGTNATNSMIRFLDNTGDAYGNGISIGGGGVVVIGAGESASNMSVSGGTESTYILSDGSNYVESNGDTIANRIGFLVDTSGNIIPVKAESGNNNALNIGSSSYKWANVYATTFNGALTGNVTGNVTGNCSGSSGSCTGNAGTATTLKTGRYLWGNYFDGSANITGTIAATKLYLNGTPSEYSASSTYALNSYVTYSGKVYKCTTAITTKEAWTAGHWTEVSNYLYNGGDTYNVGTTNIGHIYLREGSSIGFRENNSSYYTQLRYDTVGNEALILGLKNSVTSFIVKSGDSGTTATTTTGFTTSGFTPSFLVKGLSVYINELIANGDAPSYNLKVNGTTNITRATILGATLGVTGATTLSSTLGVSGATTLSSTLTVAGNVTLNGSTNTINSLTAGNLVVNGASSLTGDVSLGTVKLGTWLGGTIGVAYGGTGATSFTANSVIMSGSSTTAALTTRSITNNTSASACTASTNLITANTLAYWTGSSNISTLGTISTGTWHGSKIADNYISSASTWNALKTNVTSHLYAGTTGATSNATSDTTNTTTYLSLVEGTTLDSLIQVTGSGSVSVKTKNGVLTITGTTYTNNVSTPSEAITLVTDTNYSLSTASWQTGPSMTSYSGTYAISIKDSATNTNYYTGLIILNGSTGRNAVEEIPLFSCMATSSDSDTPTRIFAGMKQGVLLLSSQDANGTNHKLTIKILKLIAI